MFQRGALNAHSLLAGLISEVRDDGTELNLDLGPTEVVESSAVASTEYLEINRNMSKVRKISVKSGSFFTSLSFLVKMILLKMIL